MPHVIIDHPVAPVAYWRAFRPHKETLADGTILETRAAYLRGDGDTVLVQVMALELGPAQHFFIAVEGKKKTVTVRLHPYPSPARSAGVKALVAHVAREVLKLGGTVAKTNLELGQGPAQE